MHILPSPHKRHTELSSPSSLVAAGAVLGYSLPIPSSLPPSLPSFLVAPLVSPTRELELVLDELKGLRLGLDELEGLGVGLDELKDLIR